MDHVVIAYSAIVQSSRSPGCVPAGVLTVTVPRFCAAVSSVIVEPATAALIIDPVTTG